MNGQAATDSRFCMAMMKEGGGSGKPLFTSEEDAAIAAAAQMYYLCEQYRIEYCTLIYSICVGNNVYYSYADIVYGEPHRCQPLDAKDSVPDGAQIVAYVHTHPNSYKFSGGDANYADKRGWNGYVAIPNYTVLKYECGSEDLNGVTIGEFVPVAITLSQEEVEKLKEIWYGHFEADGTCRKFTICSSVEWPTY